MSLVVKPGGTATEEDASLVAAELARLPAAIAEEFRRKRISIVACRTAVTDFAVELADPSQVPEGWPPGSSWTIVPGAYVPARRSVVIATCGPDDAGPRRVPRRGEGHGARSLAVHETVHGYDYASGDLKSQDPVFLQAWESDREVLGDIYFSGETWGPRESYAEAAARTFGLDQEDAGAWPSLTAFWQGFAPFNPSLAMRAANAINAVLRNTRSRDGEPLGRGQMEPSGVIHLDLTGESRSGAIGHARITVKPGDLTYMDVRRHLEAEQPMNVLTPNASVLLRRFPKS